MKVSSALLVSRKSAHPTLLPMPWKKPHVRDLPENVIKVARNCRQAQECRKKLMKRGNGAMKEMVMSEEGPHLKEGAYSQGKAMRHS